mmetsp:Transcript_16784/g.30448  ORF Transcript_16784/g.30448 Transcript_16784/m.30448 type:complete len:277 (+) Transcript_16784:350-1180(+)
MPPIPLRLLLLLLLSMDCMGVRPAGAREAEFSLPMLLILLEEVEEDMAILNFWKNRSRCAGFAKPSPPPPPPPAFRAPLDVLLAIICANGDNPLLSFPSPKSFASPPLPEALLPDCDASELALDGIRDSPLIRFSMSPPNICPGCVVVCLLEFPTAGLFIFILPAARRNTARSLTETEARCDPMSVLACGIPPLLGTAGGKPWFPPEFLEDPVETVLTEEGVNVRLDPERGMVVEVEVLSPPSPSFVDEPWLPSPVPSSAMAFIIGFVSSKLLLKD